MRERDSLTKQRVAAPPNVPRKSLINPSASNVPDLPLGKVESLSVPNAGHTPAEMLAKRRSSHDLRPLSSRRSSYRGGGEGDRVSAYIGRRKKQAKIDTDKFLANYNKNTSTAYVINIKDVQDLSLKDTTFGNGQENKRGSEGKFAVKSTSSNTEYFLEYHCTLYSG